jgi:hypothetical protein
LWAKTMFWHFLFGHVQSPILTIMVNERDDPLAIFGTCSPLCKYRFVWTTTFYPASLLWS